MQKFHRDFKPGKDYTVEAVRFYRSNLDSSHYLDDMSANGTTHVMIKVDIAGRPCLVAGKSKCGPRDNFSKKIGRAIAIGRAVQAASHLKKGLMLPAKLECPLIAIEDKR